MGAALRGDGMTALLTSVPGDIPGLLRRGSVIRTAVVGYRGVAITGQVEPMDDGTPGLLWCAELGAGSVYHEALTDLVLDLTDPTGCWHAAVWAEQATTYADVMEALRHTEHVFYVEVIDAICRAKASQMMTPTQIDALARLVLRLAGRTA